MADERVPYHDLVKQLLDDMEPEEGGAMLPDDAFTKWAAVLREHRQAQTLAEQLVGLGIRFLRLGALRSARQFAVLAVAATDAEWVREALEQGGAASEDAMKLVDQAGGVAAKTLDGLEPPKAGGPKRG
jgi:hypothetical protein